MISLEKRILLFPQVHSVQDIFSNFDDSIIYNVIGSQRLIYDKLVDSYNSGNKQVAVEGLSKQLFDLYLGNSSKLTSKIITILAYGDQSLLDDEKISFVKGKIKQFGEQNLIFLAGAAYKLSLDYGAKLIPTEDDDNFKKNVELMRSGKKLQRELSKDISYDLPLFGSEDNLMALELGLDMDLYKKYITLLSQFKDYIVVGREKTTLQLIRDYSSNEEKKINLVYGEKHLFLDSINKWNFFNSNSPFSLERLELDYR